MNLVLLSVLAFAPPALQSMQSKIKDAPAPFVTLPVAITGRVGDFIPVRPTTNGEQVIFVALDDGLSVFPSDMLIDKRTTVVSSARDGNYRLMAYTALGNVPSQPFITNVVIGTPRPPNPNPGPDPGPDPVPVPVPPVRPPGFPGEIFDQMKNFPKAQIKIVAEVVEDKLNALNGNPALKASLIKDILAGMEQKGFKKGEAPWSGFIDWLRVTMLVKWPQGTDDDVIAGMYYWKTALEALAK